MKRKTKTPALLTVSAFSFQHGHDRRTVARRLKFFGIEPRRVKGRFKYFDTAAMSRVMQETALEAGNPPEAEPGGNLGRMRLDRVRADRLEFELGVRKRMFIPVDEVKMTFTRAVVACKSKFLAIPTAIAPRLAMTPEAADCAAL